MLVESPGQLREDELAELYRLLLPPDGVGRAAASNADAPRHDARDAVNAERRPQGPGAVQGGSDPSTPAFESPILAHGRARSAAT